MRRCSATVTSSRRGAGSPRWQAGAAACRRATPPSRAGKRVGGSPRRAPAQCNQCNAGPEPRLGHLPLLAARVFLNMGRGAFGSEGPHACSPQERIWVVARGRPYLTVQLHLPVRAVATGRRQPPGLRQIANVVLPHNPALVAFVASVAASVPCRALSAMATKATKTTEPQAPIRDLLCRTARRRRDLGLATFGNRKPVAIDCTHIEAIGQIARV